MLVSECLAWHFLGVGHGAEAGVDEEKSKSHESSMDLHWATGLK